MNLENYLLERVLSEKAVIDELLRIDNSIQKTNYTYEMFLDKIKGIPKLSLALEEPCNFLTDGDPDTVYRVLISSTNIRKLHINRSFVAMNKWLVERTKEYYQENGIEFSFYLDIERPYVNYIEENIGIILYGFKEFVIGLKEVLEQKNMLAIEK